jgi:phage terminase small subunit
MKNLFLTAKQTRFIDEFLVDSNGAAAAVRAGYAPGSAKVAASRMLTKDGTDRSLLSTPSGRGRRQARS